jgi:ankyrin repeat protein
MTRAVSLLQAAGLGDCAALVALLDDGADPNDEHPATGATALYNACFGSQVEAVRILLSRGADPNKRIVYRSPVDGRVDAGTVLLMVPSSPTVVRLLLEAGADATARDEDGRTVLMRIVGGAPLAVFEMLLQAGADGKARANDGRSAADIVRKKQVWWRRFAPDKNPEHQAELGRILALLEEGRESSVPA